MIGLKSPISITVSIIIIMFAAFIGMNYSSASLSTKQAREYHENAIHQIEASDFDSDVINQCVSDAAKNGYTLKVSNDGFYENSSRYKVTLTYHSRVVLLGINQTHTLEGYAL